MKSRVRDSEWTLGVSWSVVVMSVSLCRLAVSLPCSPRHRRFLLGVLDAFGADVPAPAGGQEAGAVFADQPAGPSAAHAPTAVVACIRAKHPVAVRLHSGPFAEAAYRRGLGFCPACRLQSLKSARGARFFSFFFARAHGTYPLSRPHQSETQSVTCKDRSIAERSGAGS